MRLRSTLKTKDGAPPKALETRALSSLSHTHTRTHSSAAVALSSRLALAAVTLGAAKGSKTNGEAAAGCGGDVIGRVMISI